MQPYDSSFIISQNYLGNDGTQNYLVFQLLVKYFEVPKTINSKVISWKSKSCQMKLLNP